MKESTHEKKVRQKNSVASTSSIRRMRSKIAWRLHMSRAMSGIWMRRNINSSLPMLVMKLWLMLMKLTMG